MKRGPLGKPDFRIGDPACGTDGFLLAGHVNPSQRFTRSSICFS